MSDLVSLARWHALLLRLRPTVVVAATPKAALLGMVASAVVGVPRRICWLWGARWEDMTGGGACLVRTSDRLAIGCATHVAAVSRSLAEIYVERGLSESVPAVPCSGGSKGVDLQRFYPPHSAPTGTPVVVFIGRVARSKGIDDFLGVVDQFHLETPDCVFIVVGALDESDPPDLAIQERLERQRDLVWVKHVDNVEDYMRRASVLLFPSAREGLPNVVMEAAACGVPTVAYDVTGVRDAVVEGETGFLVTAGDRSALAKRVKEIISDRELRARLSLGASRLAREQFSSADVEAEFEDFINRAITSGRRPSRRGGPGYAS